MRLLAFLEYSAIVIGMIAIAAGRYYALSKGVHLGVFLVGAGIALGGLESIATRRMGFRFATAGEEAWSGTPALIVGWMAFAIGATIIVSAYLLDQGQWQRTLSHLARRPGPVLAGGGLLAVGAGVLLMLNPRGRRGLWWTLFVRVPKWVAGLLLAVAGLVSVGLGVLEWFDPREYARIVDEARRLLDPGPLERWWRSLTRLMR